MKALVLGAEGNIGRPLVGHLREAGWDVLEVDIRPGWRDGYMVADVNHPLDLVPAFDWGPDVVFMLAGVVGRVLVEQAPGLAIATNMGGLTNVLQLTKRGRARLVFLSTSEVYGPGCDPMDEALSDPKPNNRYGLSKLLGERLVEYEARTYGLRAASIRPFMIYNEEETFGAHRSAMIRFARELAEGRPIDVHRGSERAWLHISDAVRAIEAAAALDDYAVVNLGHPDNRSMAELAGMIRAEVGASPDLIREKDLPARMTLRKRPTLDRQRELLGFEPRVSLEEGVRRVCARVGERLAFERGLASR